MTILFGGTGVQPTLRGQPTNVWSLQAGSTKLIPAGAWQITTGLYSCIQELDAITGIWRAIGTGYGSCTGTQFVNSDGNNFRIANQSGTVVGAIVTTAGAGYTAAPTITVNQGGGAIFKPIIGGAVSTTVTVTNGGTNYTYPPIVLFDAPPAGAGVQATGHSTLAAGVVSSITVDDQGAGYVNIPNVYLQNDPRELNPAATSITTGSGATATATLTGSGTITAILVTDSGSAISSSVLPTLAFSGASTSTAAATAIMNWSINSYSITSAGSGYVAPMFLMAVDSGFTATAGSTTNPTITSALVRTRPARFKPILTGTVASTTGTIQDGGVFSGVPTMSMVASSIASVNTPTLFVPILGGIQDTQLLQPV